MKTSRSCGFLATCLRSEEEGGTRLTCTILWMLCRMTEVSMGMPDTPTDRLACLCRSSICQKGVRGNRERHQRSSLDSKEARAYLGGQLLHLISHLSDGQTDLRVLLSGLSHQEGSHVGGAWRGRVSSLHCSIPFLSRAILI